MTEMMAFGIKLMIAAFVLTVPVIAVALLGWHFGGSFSKVAITAAVTELIFVVLSVLMFRDT